MNETYAHAENGTLKSTLDSKEITSAERFSKAIGREIYPHVCSILLFFPSSLMKEEEGNSTQIHTRIVDPGEKQQISNLRGEN